MSLPPHSLTNPKVSLDLNHETLQQTLRAQGEMWHNLVTERCPHLFADVPVFITAAQMRQMREVIEAVERVVGSGEWGVGSGEWMRETPLLNPLPQAGEEANEKGNSLILAGEGASSFRSKR